MSLSKKFTYLSRFYKTTVDNLLPLAKDKAQLKDNFAEDQGKGNKEGNTHTTLRGKVAHKIIETYTHAKVCCSFTNYITGYISCILCTSSSHILKKVASRRLLDKIS